MCRYRDALPTPDALPIHSGKPHHLWCRSHASVGPAESSAVVIVGYKATSPGGRMSRQFLAEGLTLSGGDYTIVGVIAVVALAALAIGYVLLKEVLAAGQGTAKMQDIAKAVQEGAAAYLKRQRNTLVVFGAIVFLLLFALPADDWSERIGRSLFFLVGAAFSFTIGYLGMWLATRASLRVAAASREEGGRETAMRIAFRTGGVVGMITVGLGLFGAAVVVMVYAGQAPKVLEGFGFGAALIAMFMRVGGGIFTKAAA